MGVVMMQWFQARPVELAVRTPRKTGCLWPLEESGQLAQVDNAVRSESVVTLRLGQGSIVVSSVLTFNAPEPLAAGRSLVPQGATR